MLDKQVEINEVLEMKYQFRYVNSRIQVVMNHLYLYTDLYDVSFG